MPLSVPRLFYTDHYPITLPESHKFPVLKYGMVRKLLEKDGLFQFEPAPPATMEQIELAHDPAYVRSVHSDPLSHATSARAEKLKNASHHHSQ